MQRRSSVVKDSSFGATGPGVLGMEAAAGGGLQRKFSISACRRHSSIELSDNQFMLTLIISNAETNESIAYKQDGSRFGGSHFTLKLCTNTLYKVYVKTKPAQQFLTLNIGGNDLKLVPIDGGSGEYAAVWNTVDKVPTKTGTRQEIELILTGVERTLSKKLQVKFYQHNDNHAGWGQKLDQITWHCAFNDIGNVVVLEEQTL